MFKAPGRARRLEIVGSAAAGVAHDLNNQLTLILNHIDTDDMDGLRQAARRCATLTSGLLDFCRGQAPEIHSLDLARFVSDYTHRLTLEDGIRLRVNIRTPTARIMGDSAKIMRVLDNLISNGCAAMSAGGQLTIEVNGNELSVADTGQGIPRGQRARIFDAFFSTKGPAGSGLGLAIAREIMRELGGSVALDQDYYAGARFVLRFRPA